MNRRGASVRRVDNARAIVTMDGTFSGPAVAQPIRKTRERFNIPGHARELTFSCHGRMPLLTSDRSKQWLVDALARARVGLGFELWAYVIMPEHVHLLLLPPAHGADIASILKGIKQPVARTATNFLRRSDNRRWLERLKVCRPNGRVEHRFWQQGGGYDRNIVTAKAAQSVVEYIHNNPVRRGFVDCPTDWRWSSARWYDGCRDTKLDMGTVGFEALP